MTKCTERSMVKAADKGLSINVANSNFRFERKFVYPNANKDDIIQKIYLNSYGFKEVFHQRKVNNVYFDDSNHNFYKQNVEGVADRKKVRLRWYGGDTATIEDPTIEIKKKMGEVGDKDSHKLKGKKTNLTTINSSELLDFMLENTKNKGALNHLIKVLQPSLLNTYERRYFLSFCGKFRITVDFNQNFHNPNCIFHENNRTSLNDVIVELKYALKDDREARQVSQQINARLSKNSKYVNGINLLYHPTLF